MSNEFGASSGTSIGRAKERVVGVLVCGTRRVNDFQVCTEDTTGVLLRERERLVCLGNVILKIVWVMIIVCFVSL